MEGARHTYKERTSVHREPRLTARLGGSERVGRPSGVTLHLLQGRDPWLESSCRPQKEPVGVRRRSVRSRTEEPAVRMLAWLRAACLSAGIAACLVSCATLTTPIPPTYTQDELKAICERNGFRWYPDDLVGGFCERR